MSQGNHHSPQIIPKNSRYLQHKVRLPYHLRNDLLTTCQMLSFHEKNLYKQTEKFANTNKCLGLHVSRCKWLIVRYLFLRLIGVEQVTDKNLWICLLIAHRHQIGLKLIHTKQSHPFDYSKIHTFSETRTNLFKTLSVK